jgi:methyl-accepting chemotaxis protein
MSEKENAEKTERLKGTIEKISQSIYHENVLTSFIKNLDEVLGERFAEATEITEDVGNKIISSINDTESVTNEIEDMTQKSVEEKDELISLNVETINKLKEIGSNLDTVKDDVNKSIELVSQSLVSFEDVVAITDNINKIARRTNILSINASIEAARAGESGRGFAVVAEEIQKLSEETNISSKNITEKISGISTEIKNVLEKINYIAKIFNVVANVTTNSLGILEKNEKFLEDLIETLQTNSNSLRKNFEALNISKDNIVELIAMIKSLDAVIRSVLKMQKRIKDIHI